jgi:hypothetical protein
MYPNVMIPLTAYLFSDKYIVACRCKAVSASQISTSSPNRLRILCLLALCLLLLRLDLYSSLNLPIPLSFFHTFSFYTLLLLLFDTVNYSSCCYNHSFFWFSVCFLSFALIYSVLSLCFFPTQVAQRSLLLRIKMDDKFACFI